MGGRLIVPNVLLSTLAAAALVVTLALLPSIGSQLVPTAILAGATPATTVVHLLGDEIAPVVGAETADTRVRASTRSIAAFPLIAIVLASLAGVATLGTGRHRVHPGRMLVLATLAARPPGRAPPLLHVR